VNGERMEGKSKRSETPSGASRLQRWFYCFVTIVVYLWGLAYHRLERRGRIPRNLEGPLVFVSNHASNLDPVLIGASIPDMLHFLAKKELFAIPVLGWLVRSLNSIPLDRRGIDRAALRTAVGALRQGGKLLLFPEGTRSKDGSLGRARAGAGMIAAMGKARIAPVYIEGTREAMPVGASWIRPRKVRIVFGDPVDLPARPEGVSNKEYYQRCAEEMMERIAQVRDSAASRPAWRPGADLQSPPGTPEDVKK